MAARARSADRTILTVETLPRRLAGHGADLRRDIDRIRQSLGEPGWAAAIASPVNSMEFSEFTHY